MKRAGGLVFLGLLLSNGAAGATPAACTIRKGVYDEWLSLEKRGSSPRKVLKLLGGPRASTPDAASGQAIGEAYQGYFQCLSDTVVKKEEKPPLSFCEGAAGDRLAAFVCQTAAYIKQERAASKEFIDAFPAGKKAGEMIWDLDAIASLESSKEAVLFPPKGPAYKAIDELFVLVLDGQESAVSKYFNIAGAASDAGARYMDGQIKVLLLEAPAVVVKQWPTVRQYLPILKKQLQAMPPEELRKIRLGMAGFCAKDNLDCPEILRTFGKE